MAGRFLLTRDVSDLCIGKPPLRWLPPSSTVAHAVAELDAHGPDAAVAVWDGKGTTTVAGRVRMADVVLFLCADGSNLASPAAALQATLADLLATSGAGTPPVRRIEPHARLLQAVDALLGGAQCLVVPIRDNRRRASASADGETVMCWLTVEDVVRFFLGSVALFSPTASRSVSDLGVVRPVTALAVAATDHALSAVVRGALATHASVAVVSGGGRRLEGEILPSTLCSLDASVAAAAFAALSAGELASFVDCGRAHQEAALRVVRSRLRRRNLLGMLDLLDGNDPSSPSSSSSSSSPFSSSSSSEDDDEEENITATAPYITRPTDEHGSWAARWSKGRRGAAKEPIACRRGSSLVAVMAQAVAHRVTHVWVVEDEGDEKELVGVVGFLGVLRALRHHLRPSADEQPVQTTAVRTSGKCTEQSVRLALSETTI